MQKKFFFLFVYYKIGGVAFAQRQRLGVIKIICAPLQRARILRCQTYANESEDAITFGLVYFDFV